MITAVKLSTNCVVITLQKRLVEMQRFFRTIGEKWKGLPESARDSYRKKAADSGYSSVSPPSPNKRAKRIIKNIMKEVIIAT